MIAPIVLNIVGAIMNKRRLYEKELKKREAIALELYGTQKYHLIEKNHKRILWLRKYLGIKNEPKRISVATLLLQKMFK